MLWRDIIDLVTVSTTVNDIGDAVDTQTSTQVFANKKSVRQSEFYQAMANGLKPAIMFEIRLTDYNEERYLIFNDKEYEVIRTYNKNDEIIELVCNNLINNILARSVLFSPSGSDNLITADNEIFKVRSA